MKSCPGVLGEPKNPADVWGVGVDEKGGRCWAEDIALSSCFSSETERCS